MTKTKKQKHVPKSIENYIFTYYQGIKSGTITVSRWVSLAYEYIIKGLEEKSFYFDQKKADHVITWIEKHCFHTEGRLAPGPLKLELWQKAFLSALFGIVDENGHRQFREVFFCVARKNGKSLLASAIARYVWINEGYGTRVFNIAPKLDQADIIYQNIWTMSTLDPEWIAKKEATQIRDAHKRRINGDDETMERHRMSDLVYPINNSTVKKIAFSAKKSDGFNPSLCICDEVASWDAAQGLKQYEVMKSGMGARDEPIMLSISTAGYINDGIYDELLKRSTRFLLGESKERRLLPILYMIDDVESWNDINELRKSNPNLGVSVSIDYLLDEIAIAEDSLSKKAEFIVKYCCVKQNSSVAWLSAQTVQKCVSEPISLEQFREHYAVMGIDLSRTTDLTSAVLLIEKDGIINTFARFYMPREKVDEATARDGLPYRAYIQRGILYESGDNFVDYHDVVDWARELVQMHIYPLMIGYDRYSAQYMVQELQNGGCRCDDVYQGENLTSTIREFEGMAKDGKIRIGDNDLLKIHFLNSALKMNTETERVRLIKIDQRAHIDGMAAMLDAMCVRQKWWNELGTRLTNERR